jgi:hypothetical protein
VSDHRRDRRIWPELKAMTKPPLHPAQCRRERGGQGSGQQGRGVHEPQRTDGMAASSARHMHAFSPQRRVYGSEEHIHSQSSEVSIEQEAKMERLIRRGRVSCTHPPSPCAAGLTLVFTWPGGFLEVAKRRARTPGHVGKKEARGAEHCALWCGVVWALACFPGVAFRMMSNDLGDSAMDGMEAAPVCFLRVRTGRFPSLPFPPPGAGQPAVPCIDAVLRLFGRAGQQQRWCSR